MLDYPGEVLLFSVVRLLLPFFLSPGLTVQNILDLLFKGRARGHTCGSWVHSAGGTSISCLTSFPGSGSTSKG